MAKDPTFAELQRLYAAALDRINELREQRDAAREAQAQREGECRARAFAEAAQYVRDLAAAANRATPDMLALADLIERLALSPTGTGKEGDRG